MLTITPPTAAPAPTVSATTVSAPPTTARTRRPTRPLTRWVECSHTLSGLPCMNHHPHAGDGLGCVHYSTSGVPDRHDDD